MSASIPNVLIWLIFVIVIVIVLIVVLKLLIGVLFIYIAPTIEVSDTFPAYTETGSTLILVSLSSDTSYLSF